MEMSEKDLKKFMEKVVKGKTETDCWTWNSYHCSGQRPGFYIKGKNKLAYRIMHELFKGPIPKGLCVCHKCDNPGCINPDHLFVGTHQDNMTDMVKKGRQAKGDILAMKGEDHPNVKLTEGQVKEIRHEYNTKGTSYRKLGKYYNISHAQIYKIINNKRWKDVE